MVGGEPARRGRHPGPLGGPDVNEMRRVVAHYVEKVTVLPAMTEDPRTGKPRKATDRERIALTLRVERDLVPVVLR